MKATENHRSVIADNARLPLCTIFTADRELAVLRLAADRRNEGVQRRGHGTSRRHRMYKVFSRKIEWLVLLAFTFSSLGLAVVFASCVGGQRLDTGTALHRLRQVRKGEEEYQKSIGNGRFGTMNELGEAGLIPAELVDGEDSGYRFELKTDGLTYSITANPAENGTNQELGNSFFMDESGVIRASNKHLTPANASSEPINNP